MKTTLLFLHLSSIFLIISLFPGGSLSQNISFSNKPPTIVHPMKNQQNANRLINEKSPYLLQHAYNPVDWYPWGEEPFTRAEAEGKPVFLSIGYSTCHWCHVMEEESFENPEIAALLNENFISIKVDREERPDIDQLYMFATQTMTGSGGWPMSVFLFPDKKPFYAGTYFPPEPRYGNPGFPGLLKAIMKAWKENRQGLAGSADKITSFLKNSSISVSSDKLENRWLDEGYKDLEKNYDPEFAGFGETNKFPRPAGLDFLLLYHQRNGSDMAMRMVRDTMTAMASGGMYDHLGGGFHRYSVDRQWRIPHFEKMLYDQAQLITTYLHLYQKTGEMLFAQTARETLNYVLRDMHHALGGFYAAEDADSENPYNSIEHGEGAFYLWQYSEIRELLGKKDAEIFSSAYGVKKNGNALNDPGAEFTGRNILYLPQGIRKTAKLLDLSEEVVQTSLTASRQKLLKHRQQRTRPHLDDKIITAWNGLMLSALAKGGQILNDTSYIDEAHTTADFLLNHLMVNNKLTRRWRDGDARFPATLKDYAFVIQGLLDLYQASHRVDRLQQAMKLTQIQVALFSDSAGGFYNSIESTELLARMKESYDGAQPSGNSVAARNFLRLGHLTGNSEWLATGEDTVKAFGNLFESHASAMPSMLLALDLALEKPRQIVITGDLETEDTQAMLHEVNSRYLPNAFILLADNGENQKFLGNFLTFLQNTGPIEGKSTAYVCEEFVCKQPTNSPKTLAEMLGNTSQHRNITGK